MLKVRDIMTRDVISLAEDTSVEAAAWRLQYESVSGAPVRDRKGNVIGVLSTSDLVDPLRHGEREKRVSETMTPGVWAVHPEDPALEAVKLMVETGCHRVIVVRGPGKLQGILTSMDVMRAVADGTDFYGTGKAAMQRAPREDSEDAEEDEESQAAAEGRR